mmetsp:Transcript_87730/g.145856  ORF Transcript_87730/g.145856 Transcript_87730/m.145856 type:complete len:202 (+) Transcript_87730:370-975(+)
MKCGERGHFGQAFHDLRVLAKHDAGRGADGGIDLSLLLHVHHNLVQSLAVAEVLCPGHTAGARDQVEILGLHIFNQDVGLHSNASGHGDVLGGHDGGHHDLDPGPVQNVRCGGELDVFRTISNGAQGSNLLRGGGSHSHAGFGAKLQSDCMFSRDRALRCPTAAEIPHGQRHERKQQKPRGLADGLTAEGPMVLYILLFLC